MFDVASKHQGMIESRSVLYGCSLAGFLAQDDFGTGIQANGLASILIDPADFTFNLCKFLSDGCLIIIIRLGVNII